MKSIMLNINEIKTHFSKYARQIKKGRRVILCDRNKPFAEIRPLHLTLEGRRPFGLGRGLIALPDDFDRPDAAIEALFTGEEA